MEKYLIIIAKSEKNYSAYAPDVLGCIATGQTIEETLTNMVEALQFHFEGMRDDEVEIPTPKGFNYHFNSGELPIGADYFITEAFVQIPHHV